jgi:hypothetical protein
MSRDTPQDRAALNAAFARHVAAKLGPQAAYEPATICAAGHRNAVNRPIGSLCAACEEAWLTKAAQSEAGEGLLSILVKRNDPAWHPEWRIGPGEPKDFCGSLDRTVQALAALGLWWEVDRNRVRVLPAGRWTQVVVVDIPDVLDEPHSAPVIATALVRAALRVLAAVPRA